MGFHTHLILKGSTFRRRNIKHQFITLQNLKLRLNWYSINFAKRVKLALHRYLINSLVTGVANVRNVLGILLKNGKLLLTITAVPYN